MQGKRANVLGSMGFYRSRARCAGRPFGFHSQASDILQSRLLRRPVREYVSRTELALEKTPIVEPGSLSSPGALFCFMHNVIDWLSSSVVRQWLCVMIAGSLGTILLRPYYLIVGLPATGVAWLMHRSDLLRAPRFFLTETLLWCVTLVGCASIARIAMSNDRPSRNVIFSIAVAIVVLSASAQLAVVPKFAREAYLLRSTSVYSSQERQEADAVLARYRCESKPEEPVVASSMLFRYAHDRNLFWLIPLHNRPAPVWILGDTGSAYDP